jgi:DNA polymerase I-like protein with 3'-5' exonuclease and polymerase domains
MFVPDEGMIWFDADLKGADAQVVAWDADDEDLKLAFRSGIDVHAKNAADMLGAVFSRLSADDPQRKRIRQDNKRAVHATNYIGSARAVAAALGWTVHEAERFQQRWFSIHPKIREWHRRIERELVVNKGRIKNAFGYHRIYFDRLESVLPQAIAWIPQSTVALVTIYGAINLRKHLRLDGKPFDPLCLQVHDSLDFQLPKTRLDLLPQIRDLLHIPVPYPDPLIIPWELKMSPISWGACKSCDWEGKLIN